MEKDELKPSESISRDALATIAATIVIGSVPLVSPRIPFEVGLVLWIFSGGIFLFASWGWIKDRLLMLWRAQKQAGPAEASTPELWSEQDEANLIWTGGKQQAAELATPAATPRKKRQPKKGASEQAAEEIGKMARIAGHLSPPSIKGRDTDITNALGWAIHAVWDAPVRGPFITIPPISLDGPIERFRQAALDGDLRVWGRRDPNGLIEEINPGFWEDNTLDESALRAILSQSRTIPFEGAKTDERFYRIMVNRAEVERVWPHAG